jgi:hypothetical protein
MAITGILPTSASPLQNHNHLSLIPKTQISQYQITSKAHLNSLQKSTNRHENRKDQMEAALPTMSEILKSSRAQKVDLQLQTLGPFFRITARSLETQNELGKAEGMIRVWVRGRILHLDSIRLRRETLGMEKSIFGIGLFLGAVAVRHGYDCGCKTAELLAINDSDLYHSKVLVLPIQSLPFLLFFHLTKKCNIFILLSTQISYKFGPRNSYNPTSKKLTRILLTREKYNIFLKIRYFSHSRPTLVKLSNQLLNLFYSMRVLHYISND